jgi:hypothetical protein
MHIRRLALVAAAIGVAAAILAAPGIASRPVVASGGGIGTTDGVNPFSHFGFGVFFSGTSARGNFNCLMAGNAAFPDFEPLMKVSGAVTGGTVDTATGTAVFAGSGTLNLGPSGSRPARFVVHVREGTAGIGKLQLTVIDPPFLVPEETVLAGRIDIH